MSKSIITASQISGSSVGTGSFGTLTVQDVTPKAFGLTIGNNVNSGFSSYTDYQILLHDTGAVNTSYGIGIRSNHMVFNSDNNYDFRKDNSTLFRATGDALIVNTDISGSLTSTGSFGKLRVMGLGSSVAPRFDIDDAGNTTFSGSNATMTVRYGGNATTTQPGLNINGKNMMFVANSTEVFRASSGGHFIVNENGIDMDTRIETNNQTNTFTVDGATDKVAIGVGLGGGHDEKFKVAGDVGITGSLHVSGNITTSGSIIAQEFRTELINQTVVQASGSTTFGDSIDDIHRFTGSIFEFTGSALRVVDNALLGIGSSTDLNISHNGTNGVISEGTGNLTIRTLANDKDVIFQSDDGSGGVASYITLDGSTTDLSLTPPGITHLLEATAGTPASTYAAPLSASLVIEDDATPTKNSIVIKTHDVGEDKVIGALKFAISPDSSNFNWTGIQGIAGTSAMAQDLVFYTSDSNTGGNTSTERLRITQNKISGSLTSTGSFGALVIDPLHKGFTIGNHTNKARIIYNAGYFQFTDADNSYGGIAAESGSFYGDVGIRATKKLYFDDGEPPVAGHTYIHESAADIMDIVVGGQQMLQLVEGSTDYIRTPDNVLLGVGGAIDLYMNHNGTNSFLQNTTGQLIIKNTDTNEDIFIQGDDGGNIITAIQIDVSESGSILLPNDLQYLKIGAGGDGVLYSYNDDFYVSNFTAGKDTVFQYLKSDGSAYVSAIQIDASAEEVKIPSDDVKFKLGAGGDLVLYHGGTDSFVQNNVGHLNFKNFANDKDIILSTDDGSGGTTAYITLDGSASLTKFHIDTKHTDGVEAIFGDSGDMKIYHIADGNSFIENNEEHLIIVNNENDHDIYLKSDNGSGGTTNYITLDGSTAKLILQRPTFIGSHFGAADSQLHVSESYMEAHIGSGSLMTVFETKGTSGNPDFKIVDKDNNNARAALQVQGNAGAVECLFVGSAGHVGIGTTSPDMDLHINTSDDGSVMFSRDGGHKYSIEHDTSQLYLYNRTLNKNQIMFSHSGPVTINNDGHSTIDFRVEGDTNANLFFTDASEDKIGIGTNAPQELLDISGSMNLHGSMTINNEIKRSHIFIKGTGLNQTGGANRVVTIAGHEVCDTTSPRGLRLDVIDGLTHQVVTSSTHDTYGSSDASNALAVTLNAFTSSNCFGVLTSYDAIENAVTLALKHAATNQGLTKLAGISGDNTLGSRHAYAALFHIRGNNVDTGLHHNHDGIIEVLSSNDRDDKNATISTHLTSYFSEPSSSGIEGGHTINALHVPGGDHSPFFVSQSGTMHISGSGRLQFDSQANYPNLIFPADHDADKIRLYAGGNEKIGTEANTMVLTADNFKFKDSGGDTNMTIDSSGQARITGPTDINLVVDSSDSGGGIAIKDSNTSGDYYNGVFCSGNELFLKTNNSERVRLDASGRVGIGCDPVGNAPSLQISGSGNDNTLIVGHNPHVTTDNKVGWSLGAHINGNIYYDHKLDGGGVIDFRYGEGTANGYDGVFLRVDGTDGDAKFYDDVHIAADSKKLFLGAGDDFQLYHDGSNSSVQNGTGALYINNVANATLHLNTNNSDRITITGDGTKTTLGQNAGQVAQIAIEPRTSDNSRKTSQITAKPYDSDRENIMMMVLDSQSSINEMAIGSNTSTYESPQIIDFYTATSTTSATNVQNFRMSCSGDFHADQDIFAASTQVSSDARLKENIKDTPYGLKEVIKIRPVEFDWKKDSGKRSGKHDIGFIAQEMEEVIPEVVKESTKLDSDENYKSIDYGKITSVLIKAVQEQQEQIKELKEDIEKLRGDE